MSTMIRRYEYERLVLLVSPRYIADYSLYQYERYLRTYPD